MAGNPVCVPEMDDAVEGLRMAMSRFIIEFGDRLDGHFREKAFTQNLKQALRQRFPHMKTPFLGMNIPLANL